MFDNITKALTIQISADDLTGGAWSSIGGAAKDLMNLATPFNQAWELASKVVNTVAAGLEKPIQMLSEGGELSEARAGVESLGQSFEVNSARMLESIRDLSDGSLNITQAMQATGDAIRRGFSEDQVESIFAFAQKFVDTMGDSKGGVLEVATKIEEAIFTGKGKSAKDFGLNIAVGTAFSDIEAQMQRLTEKIGEGSFNFGDSMEKMATAAADAGMRIKEELNNLVGREGFEDFEAGLRAQFKTVETHAEEIATAIFFPINEAWKIFSEHFLWIFDALDVGFSDTDTLGQKLVITLQTIGNTAVQTAKLLADIYNNTIGILDAVPQLAAGVMAEWNEAVLGITSKMGLEVEADKLKEFQTNLEALKSLSKNGVIRIDYSEMMKAQEEYNKKIAEAGKAFVESKDQAELFGETIDEITDIIGDADAGLDNLFDDATDGAGKFTSGIETAGESFAKTAKTISSHAKEASKAVREWIVTNGELVAQVESASSATGKGKNGSFVEWDVAKMDDFYKTTGKAIEGGLRIIEEQAKAATIMTKEQYLAGLEQTATIVSAEDYLKTLTGNGRIVSLEEYLKQGPGRTRTMTDLINERPDFKSTLGTNNFGKSGGSQSAGQASNLKVSLQGIDPKLADFVEFIIDRVTQKAIAEGVITAGV